VATHLFQPGQNRLFGNLLFLAVYRVVNFRGHLEGINDDFSRSDTSLIAKGSDLSL
jgi:hypothetical protein